MEARVWPMLPRLCRFTVSFVDIFADEVEPFFSFPPFISADECLSLVTDNFETHLSFFSLHLLRFSELH